MHLSYSQLQKWRECPARWYFNKVLGRPEPSSEASEAGNRMHDELEEYLRSGTLPVDPRARQAALTNLPGFMGKGHAEAEYRLPLPFVVEGAGVDFLCRIDWRDDESILDHKTKGSLDWVLSDWQLARDPQLLLYVHVVQSLTGTVVKRAGHHYILRKGPMKSYIAWVDVDQDLVKSNWQKALVDFEAMLAHRAADISTIPRSILSCHSYGVWCPNIVECDATRGFSDL